MAEPDPLFALTVAALLTGAALLVFWPARELMARWRRARYLRRRARREDLLKHLYSCEMAGHRATVQSVSGALQITGSEAVDLLTDLSVRGLLDHVDGRLQLTREGRESALQIVRAHRLWERHLADQTGFDAGEWHGRAERREHSLTSAEADALSARLGNPTLDPHGDPIPTAAGSLVSHGGRPLTTMAVGERLTIVHLEDEPQAIYAQLVAEGLFPGLDLCLTEVSPRRICFWTEKGEHLLAPVVAGSIFVVAVPQGEEREPGKRLSDLGLGNRGRVRAISRACRRPERRRLMDLGLLPGTLVEAEFTSPSGDPTAYRVRGALIALRREQAELIAVEPLAEESDSGSQAP